MTALRKEHHEIRKTLKSKSIDELTDAGAKDILDKETAFHNKRHALKQKFNNDLQSVISVKKILKSLYYLKTLHHLLLDLKMLQNNSLKT